MRRPDRAGGRARFPEGKGPRLRLIERRRTSSFTWQDQARRRWLALGSRRLDHELSGAGSRGARSPSENDLHTQARPRFVGRHRLRGRDESAHSPRRHPTKPISLHGHNALIDRALRDVLRRAPWARTGDPSLLEPVRAGPARAPGAGSRGVAWCRGPGSTGRRSRSTVRKTRVATSSERTPWWRLRGWDERRRADHSQRRLRANLTRWALCSSSCRRSPDAGRTRGRSRRGPWTRPRRNSIVR